MGKTKFVFGKDMTDEQMWQAFKKFAQEAGFETKDTHKLKKKARNETPRRRKNADRD